MASSADTQAGPQDAVPSAAARDARDEREVHADPRPPGSADRRVRRDGTHRAIRALKAQHSARRSTFEAFADRLTRAASSPAFFLLHIGWFALWINWNVGSLARFGLEPFDPYPFGFLTMVVSLEAIFLSIFVLMSQARESAIAELRDELTLQLNLRLEEEVTKNLQLVAGLYTRMGFRMGEDPELREMLQPWDAASVEADLMRQISDCAPEGTGRRQQLVAWLRRIRAD